MYKNEKLDLLSLNLIIRSCTLEHALKYQIVLSYIVIIKTLEILF